MIFIDVFTECKGGHPPFNYNKSGSFLATRGKTKIMAARCVVLY